MNKAQPRSGFSLRRIGGDAAVAIGGALVANAFNYLYHFMISRRLGPDGYGTLATLAAAASIIGVFGGTISIVAMQDSAKLWAHHLEARIGAFARHVAPAALGIALAIGGIAFLAGLGLGPYLHIVAWQLWLAFAAYLALAILSAFFRGISQGAHRFWLFAISYVSETTIKLVSALLLVAAGMAVLGAMGGFVLGALVGLVVVAAPFVTARSKNAPLQNAATDTGADHLELGGRALSVLWLSASLTMLLFVDQIFAKHHLSGVDAGLYGAAGTIARTIPFAVGMISLVMNPKVAAALHVSREVLRRLLFILFGAGITLALAGLVVAALAPSQLLALTYGPKYIDAAALLRLYGVAAFLLAIVGLGIGYLQAVGGYAVTRVLLAAVLAEAILMAVWGTSGPRLLYIAIATNAALLPVIAAYIAASLRSAPQAPSPLVDEAAMLG